MRRPRDGRRSRSTAQKSVIVAVDGQPSEPFEPLNNQFPMGPGARFELMFDMPRDLGAGVRLDLRGDAGEADRPFIAIASDGEPVASRPEPPRLAANPLLPAEIALEAAKRCDFAITGGGSAPFAVNGATFVDWAPKPACIIPRGAPAVFALANKTAVVQAIRLWGHVARLLHAMDDGWEPYWRDTFLIQPGRTAHVAFVADNPGKWPLESAIPRTSRGRRGGVVSGRIGSAPVAHGAFHPGLPNRPGAVRLTATSSTGRTRRAQPRPGPSGQAPPDSPTASRAPAYP